MQRPSVRGSVSGQTSLEVLFVIAFVIVFTMAIALPYVSNQTKTNVSIHTKLAILSLIEKNTQLVHVASILPQIDSSNNLTMNIETRGAWDTSPTNPASSYCTQVCVAIDPDNYYGTVALVWTNNTLPFCSAPCP